MVENPGPGFDGLRSNPAIDGLCDQTLIMSSASSGASRVAFSSGSATRIGNAVATSATPRTASGSRLASSSAIRDPMLWPTAINRRHVGGPQRIGDAVGHRLDGRREAGPSLRMWPGRSSASTP